MYSLRLNLQVFQAHGSGCQIKGGFVSGAPLEKPDVRRTRACKGLNAGSRFVP